AGGAGRHRPACTTRRKRSSGRRAATPDDGSGVAPAHGRGRAGPRTGALHGEPGCRPHAGPAGPVGLSPRRDRSRPGVNMTDIVPIRRALISVSDKTGLIPMAQALAAKGVEILSTGGSARVLREA